MARDWRCHLARALALMLLTIAAPACAQAPAAPTTAPAVDVLVDFPDAVALENPLVRIEVSPAAGRIVHFGPTGGENLIWISPERTAEISSKRHGIAYRNVGGDKIWPIQQRLWPEAFRGGAREWPPDGIIDGKPWTLIEHSQRRIVIESAPADHLAIRVRRAIEIDPTLPRITIRNSISRDKPSHFPVQIWSVTQVRWPDYVMMDVAEDRALEPGWVFFSEDVDRYLRRMADAAAIRFDIDRAPVSGQKIGTLGRWLAGVWPQHIWYQSTTFDPTGQYPDASSVQVYMDGNYAELELLSPTVHLRPGESLENTVIWHLTPRGELDERGIAAAARQLPPP